VRVCTRNEFVVQQHCFSFLELVEFCSLRNDLPGKELRKMEEEEVPIQSEEPSVNDAPENVGNGSKRMDKSRKTTHDPAFAAPEEMFWAVVLCLTVPE
ncbi:hypothetical protein ANCCAN_04451, partial [Ancylostoma caninum]